MFTEFATIFLVPSAAVIAALRRAFDLFPTSSTRHVLRWPVALAKAGGTHHSPLHTFWATFGAISRSWR